MYYSKCHGKLPLPGIFRFPANCHAPSVLLLLLVAEGIDGFAKGSVNFTIGKLIDPWWEAVTAAVHLARVAWALWAFRSQSAAALDSTRLLLLCADRFQQD